MTPPPVATTSPTALARRLVAEGRRGEAEAVVARMIADNFDLAVANVTINADWSSLNSLNGFVATSDGRRFFFKFHQEEGEERTVEEYYRAELLQRAGLPVDMPQMICRKPGQQILLYAFRRDRQLAAACLDVERGNESAIAGLVRLERNLDLLTGQIYVATLGPSSAALSAAEPIHQLFHNRLVTPPASDRIGGRVAGFYMGRSLALPFGEIPWERFSALRWRINGIDYAHSLAELFAESLERLAPATLSPCGGVVAHGDAHNANVWIESGNGEDRLVLFDPAFAGKHVPALLADVKATFHNVFAHPFWLYHPAEAADRFQVKARVEGDRIVVEHDWTLPLLRRGFLDAKAELIWRPLLARLRELGWLAPDWQRTVRTALFCCPTLVMNLCAGAAHGATAGRSPAMSALSFSIAVMAGSVPDGADVFSQFLAKISPKASARA